MSDRRLRRSVNKAILSLKYPAFSDSLKAYEYDIIPSHTVDSFIEYERDHADMQCLILDDTAFVLKGCERIIENLSDRYHIEICGDNICGEYPHNIALNALILHHKLIGNLRYLDRKLLEYCKNWGYEMIHVNQGYTKCSCAVAGEDAIITADRGVTRSLKETDIDVLLIEEGRVALEGASHGFIGGASGYIDHRLYFTGNIKAHPDYLRIRRFCEQHHTNVIVLNEELPLTDIGGIIFC